MAKLLTIAMLGVSLCGCVHSSRMGHGVVDRLETGNLRVNCTLPWACHREAERACRHGFRVLCVKHEAPYAKAGADMSCPESARAIERASEQSPPQYEWTHFIECQA